MEKLLSRCLRKDRDRRAQNMTGVKLALEELQRPSPDRPETLPSIAVLPFVNMSRDGLLVTLKAFPFNDPFRSHPRFTALLKKMGLEP